MAIEGPLRELGMQDVLQLLDLTGKTGVLHVRSERRRDEAVVHVQRGTIIFATRRQSLRRLGQQLVRAGKLTERELARALELQRQKPSHRLGEILLELGSVNKAELDRHLRLQLEETIYELLGWDEGHFRFDERSDLVRPGVGQGLRVDALLMEGARRIDEWARLEPKVPGPETVPLLAPTDERDATLLELHPDEWEVLAEIDGERDLRQIAGSLSRSTFDVAKIVFGLIGLGVAKVRDRPSALPDADLDAAMREVEGFIARGEAAQAAQRATALQEAHADRPAVALLAGRALAADGRVRAAAEAFARAAALDPLSVEAHYRLGFAALRLGEFGRAADAWSRFLALAGPGSRTSLVREGLAAVRALNQVLQQETP